MHPSSPIGNGTPQPNWEFCEQSKDGKTVTLHHLPSDEYLDVDVSILKKSFEKEHPNGNFSSWLLSNMEEIFTQAGIQNLSHQQGWTSQKQGPRKLAIDADGVKMPNRTVSWQNPNYENKLTKQAYPLHKKIEQTRQFSQDVSAPIPLEEKRILPANRTLKIITQDPHNEIELKEYVLKGQAELRGGARWSSVDAVARKHVPQLFGKSRKIRSRLMKSPVTPLPQSWDTTKVIEELQKLRSKDPELARWLIAACAQKGNIQAPQVAQGSIDLPQLFPQLSPQEQLQLLVDLTGTKKDDLVKQLGKEFIQNLNGFPPHELMQALRKEDATCAGHLIHLIAPSSSLQQKKLLLLAPPLARKVFLSQLKPEQRVELGVPTDTEAQAFQKSLSRQTGIQEETIEEKTTGLWEKLKNRIMGKASAEETSFPFSQNPNHQIFRQTLFNWNKEGTLEGQIWNRLHPNNGSNHQTFQQIQQDLAAIQDLKQEPFQEAYQLILRFMDQNQLDSIMDSASPQYFNNLDETHRTLWSLRVIQDPQNASKFRGYILNLKNTPPSPAQDWSSGDISSMLELKGSPWKTEFIHELSAELIPFTLANLSQKDRTDAIQALMSKQPEVLSQLPVEILNTLMTDPVTYPVIDELWKHYLPKDKKLEFLNQTGLDQNQPKQLQPFVRHLAQKNLLEPELIPFLTNRYIAVQAAAGASGGYQKEIVRQMTSQQIQDLVIALNKDFQNISPIITNCTQSFTVEQTHLLFALLPTSIYQDLKLPQHLGENLFRVKKARQQALQIQFDQFRNNLHFQESQLAQQNFQDLETFMKNIQFSIQKDWDPKKNSKDFSDFISFSNTMKIANMDDFQLQALLTKTVQDLPWPPPQLIGPPQNFHSNIANLVIQNQRSKTTTGPSIAKQRAEQNIDAVKEVTNLNQVFRYKASTAVIENQIAVVPQNPNWQALKGQLENELKSTNPQDIQPILSQTMRAVNLVQRALNPNLPQWTDPQIEQTVQDLYPPPS